LTLKFLVDNQFIILHGEQSKSLAQA